MPWYETTGEDNEWRRQPVYATGALISKSKSNFLLTPSIIENDIKTQLIKSWDFLVKLLGLEHN